MGKDGGKALGKAAPMRFVDLSKEFNGGFHQFWRMRVLQTALGQKKQPFVDQSGVEHFSATFPPLISCDWQLKEV